MDGDSVGIKFDWNELFEKQSNPLTQYCGIDSMYLLLPVHTLEYSNTNSKAEEDDLDYQYTINENDRNPLNTWSTNNINIKARILDGKDLLNQIQRKVWSEYLSGRGYSNKIIQWIRSYQAYDLTNPKNGEDIAKLAISVIAFEYNKLLREFKNWFISLLKNHDEVFETWTQSSLDLNEIWKNLKVKNNGNIKAWYDGCELTYDGLKLKEPVYLSFMDYVTYTVNDTEDWSYISTPWNIGGFSSRIEEKINEITVEGLRWIYSPEVSYQQHSKLSNWLIYNVFSVIGVM